MLRTVTTTPIFAPTATFCLLNRRSRLSFKAQCQSHPIHQRTRRHKSDATMTSLVVRVRWFASAHSKPILGIVYSEKTRSGSGYRHSRSWFWRHCLRSQQPPSAGRRSGGAVSAPRRWTLGIPLFLAGVLAGATIIWLVRDRSWEPEPHSVPLTSFPGYEAHPAWR